MEHWIAEPLYREIVDRVPICTVDLALFNSDATQALVFRRRDPPFEKQWFTLGGRLRKNETLQECAIRLGREEAGLALSPEGLFFGGVFEEIHDRSRFPGVAYHCVNICWGYLLERSPAIRLDRQHDEYAWRLVADSSFAPLLNTKLTAIAPLACAEAARRCSAAH